MRSTNWGDDGSDGDDSVGVMLPLVTSPKTPASTRAPVERVRHYPVMYTHHKSTYAKSLYDVEGYLLMHDDKTNLNVWSLKLKDALEAKTVRCIHVPGRPGYRYFVQSDRQQKDFIKYRDQGWAPFHADYHVYDDEPGVVIFPKHYLHASR